MLVEKPVECGERDPS